jgi:uncharacterized membrane protein YphA (DoxX/SURF4 family)
MRWTGSRPAGGLAGLYARLALGGAFLSSVAARFGLWDQRPEPFQQFIGYTGEVLSFLPRSTIPFLAVAATIIEIALGVLLLAGAALRWTALASAMLLATFAACMAVSFGLKSPLDYSVLSASAGAVLLRIQAGREGRPGS